MPSHSWVLYACFTHLWYYPPWNFDIALKDLARQWLSQNGQKPNTQCLPTRECMRRFDRAGRAGWELLRTLLGELCFFYHTGWGHPVCFVCETANSLVLRSEMFVMGRMNRNACRRQVLNTGMESNRQCRLKGLAGRVSTCGTHWWQWEVVHWRTAVVIIVWEHPVPKVVNGLRMGLCSHNLIPHRCFCRRALGSSWVRWKEGVRRGIWGGGWKEEGKGTNEVIIISKVKI